MQCRSCNYPDSRVVETRHDTHRNQITRRRECIKCGERFTTRENFRDAPKDSDYKTQPPRRILEK
jgi:transcriptional repressor NrdR